jgi:two-component system, NtrC family, nitrogen regulation response regulator GlnG
MSRPGERKHILIVDNEEAVCWSLQRALSQEGHSTAVAASAEEAFTLVTQQRPDVIILDVRLPGVDGLSALGRLRQVSSAAVIVITAFGNLTTAVRAVEAGAFDYLTKPFDLGQALAVARVLQRDNVPGQTPPDQEGLALEPEELVGRSPAMQLVFRRIALVAPHDACVLITGESGTGKELVARHPPLQPALPPALPSGASGLLEPEPGRKRAVRPRERGLYRSRADPVRVVSPGGGGTVFLDELADVPLSIQVKLLRVLEQGEMFPVGSSQPQRLDVRILAATHQDLFRRLEEGTFRQDLFFRLNVFQVPLPPLRDRKEDLPLLIRHFLRQLGADSVPVPAETLEHLAEMSWSGNVRKLRNALEHAVILARGGRLLAEHFPTPPPSPRDRNDRLTAAVRQWLAERLGTVGEDSPSGLYQELLRVMEATLLEEVMRRVRGNRWQAARWLGLNRTTVRKNWESTAWPMVLVPRNHALRADVECSQVPRDLIGQKVEPVTTGASSDPVPSHTAG